MSVSVSVCLSTAKIVSTLKNLSVAIFVFPKRGICEMRCLKCFILIWHTSDTKFHDGRFKRSGNIKVFASTISEDAVLVLLMRGTYKVNHRVRITWSDLHTKCHEDLYRSSKVAWEVDIYIQTHKYTQTWMWSDKLTSFLLLRKMGWNRHTISRDLNITRRGKTLNSLLVYTVYIYCTFA
jgi:hypothetical protein